MKKPQQKQDIKDVLNAVSSLPALEGIVCCFVFEDRQVGLITSKLSKKGTKWILEQALDILETRVMLSKDLSDITSPKLSVVFDSGAEKDNSQN